jgi:hypothetical protein
MWAAMDAWGSLPNLHPAVVHFPIALLPAALLFDFVCLLRPTWTWLDRGAAALYALAAAAAGAAFWAGTEAAESLGPLSPAARGVERVISERAAQSLIQRDRDFANYQDDGAFYEKRPGIWVEPKGDWGAGAP